MRVAGLFAGIGGFELGLRQAGHHAHFFCEILPAARAVLAARFPDVPIHPDIEELSALPQDTDLVCAGFPCQDLSQAGQTRGLAGERSGLIERVFDLIEGRDGRGTIPWLVIENVPFMLQLHGGAAMRRIVDRLESLGYRWAYRVVDSYSFGLPQRRERVFIVASLAADPANVVFADDNPLQRPKTDLASLAHGFYWTEGRGGLGWAVDSVPTLKNGSTIGIPSPPAILLSDGRVIKPSLVDAERLQGFEPIDGEPWTLPAERVAKTAARWGLVGSAVSVPVSKWIGGRILKPAAYDVVRDRTFPEVGKLPRAARFDGSQRYGVEIGTDPLGIRPPHLAEFLKYDGAPLSAKATAGFLARTRLAKLRFEPGFLAAVEQHLTRRIDAEGVDLRRQERLLVA